MRDDKLLGRTVKLFDGLLILITNAFSAGDAFQRIQTDFHRTNIDWSL